jgi:hypothetical protein
MTPQAALAGDSTTGQGLPCPSLCRVQEGTPIMTDQPARVTPGEISALLDQARQLPADAPLADLIAYHEHKASLLSRIAASLDTAEAHRVAADAWHYVGQLARQRERQEVPR